MTNRKSITYAQFDAVMAELGLRVKVIPDKYVAYQHESAKTLWMTPLHKPSDRVPWDVIASARHHLDWNGVINPNALDEMLEAAAAA